MSGRRRAVAVGVVALLVGLGVVAVVQAQPAPSSFDIIIAMEQPGTRVGSFNYLRDLPSGATWADGDRIAYRCAWTFLDYAGASNVFRVTFRRTSDYTSGGSVGRVEDLRMLEGQRAFDGSPGDGTQTAEPGFCNETYPTVAYEPLVGDPGPRPVINILDTTTGAVLEVRSYENQAEPGADFRIVETSPTLTVVIAYRFGEPVHAIYYEVLRPDVVAKTTNADPPPPPPTTTTPPPALECFVGQLASEIDGHLEDFRVCKV